MNQLDRRSFVQLALATAPFALLGATPDAPSSVSPVVRAGEGREGRRQFKVLSKETNGAMFVMEMVRRAKGGPDRHLHHEQDELFYVLEGEFLFEIGSDRFRLKTGDCVLGPRGVPHAYLFLGPDAGRLLISYAPAGKMEEYFKQFDGVRVPRPPAATPQEAEARKVASYARYGMQYLGPPITE
jgi:quercetin dioxygenase-like cupin family protein